MTSFEVNNQWEKIMDSLDDIIAVLEDPETKRTSSKKQKRKWREIEAYKDKQRLRKELQDLDYFADNLDLEELDLI
jgi:hypothetical protein|tara:strand:+ start:168 stop:395 length:228 start_codon:yes stop_codon:yes gene_type:complete